MSGGANESTRALLKLAQGGDRKARDTLVEENLALVKYLVRRFLDRGKEYDDLFQYGCMGLLKAIDRFDLDYDVAFSTYAVPVIIGEIRRYLRDDHPLHIARSISDNARRIEEYLQSAEQNGEALPSPEAIAAALGLNAEDVVLALNARQRVRSLSEPVSGGEDIALQDTLGAEPMAAVDDRLLLQELLARLSEKERTLLVRRYFYAHTQTQIARDTGMTQVQVSRLEKRLLRRMRELAEGAQPS